MPTFTGDAGTVFSQQCIGFGRSIRRNDFEGKGDLATFLDVVEAVEQGRVQGVLFSCAKIPEKIFKGALHLSFIAARPVVNLYPLPGMGMVETEGLE